MTYNASPLASCPLVLSVHDTIFRRFPQYFSPRVRVLLRTLLPLSMRRARVIITLSEASKRDLVNFYPFVRDKVVVTPLAAGPIVGVEPNFAAAEQVSRHRDFILAVGTLQPRKNVLRLVQAYIDARQQGQTHARLVVVGRAAWQYSKVYRLAAESAYSEDIIFTGYLDDATVAALYRTCTVFVYPSLYEGFGLPVLEAMALGAPVITSDRSSMPEVAGDAAILVDPYSVDQLSAAIARIFANSGVREELRHRGLRRAADFSWKHTAQQTFEIYRWALRRRNP